MPLNVLYLDDEPALCEIFADEFSSKDIIVMTFTDPKEALVAALKTPPDVIFVDYRLPRTTGDLVAQAMSSKVPKYLVTGENSVNTIYEFTAVFTKPMDIKAVRSVLNTHLMVKRSA